MSMIAKKIEKMIELDKAKRARVTQNNKNLLVQENFYLKPVQNYLKYKHKKQEFNEIYANSKIKFYYTIYSSALSKFVRKRLIGFVIWTSLSAAAFYIINIVGVYKLLDWTWSQTLGRIIKL